MKTTERKTPKGGIEQSNNIRQKYISLKLALPISSACFLLLSTSIFFIARLPKSEHSMVTISSNIV